VKRKKERFKIIEERQNVIEPTKENYHDMKGCWRSHHFNNQHPITLELACGRGEYTVGLASLFPNCNYIGVDMKGERIWKGSGVAIENKLVNVAFLRTHILMIDNFFDENEIDEIWITFPDPRARKRDIKRRLTNPRYLAMYKRMIKPGGYIRLKTDNTALYEYTLEVLSERKDIHDLKHTENIYQSDLRAECFDIKTKFEEQFSQRGESIKYLRFHF
jgi:tRNA (guanine-N7-)-methyltransferase